MSARSPLDEAAIRRQIAGGLRRARRAAGLTLEQAALRLNRSASGLQHLEMGRHSVRVEQLPELAVTFGCTVRELLVHMRLVRRPRPARGRQHPDIAAGAFDGGSAQGDRSTACDPRGDAGHPHRTADPGPAQ